MLEQNTVPDVKEQVKMTGQSIQVYPCLETQYNQFFVLVGFPSNGNLSPDFCCDSVHNC